MFSLKKYVAPELEITKAEAVDVLNGSAEGEDTFIDVGDLFGTLWTNET